MYIWDGTDSLSIPEWGLQLGDLVTERERAAPDLARLEDTGLSYKKMEVDSSS